MQRRQLFILFICILMPRVIGAAVLPLLPLYLAQLGADSGLTGVFIAVAFASLFVGTLSSGWLARRIPHPRAIIGAASLAGMLAMLMMGAADSLPLLGLMMVTGWLFGSMIMAMTNILAGMYADPARRGSVFGILGLSVATSQMIAGVISGPIIDHAGFPALFTVLAFAMLLVFVGVLFLKPPTPRADKTSTLEAIAVSSAPKRGLSSELYPIVIGSVIAFVVMFSNNLGRPIAMNGLNFAATAISATVAISGLFALPLPVVIGWLSDRFGRRRLLALSYLMIAAASLLLPFAGTLWQFTLITLLVTVGSGCVNVGAALISDLSSRKTLSSNMAVYQATTPFGGIIGYGLTGYVIQGMGFNATFLLAALLPLISIWLLWSGSARETRLAPVRG
jgi:MFS family permease